jgi:hypothetical protein
MEQWPAIFQRIPQIVAGVQAAFGAEVYEFFHSQQNPMISGSRDSGKKIIGANISLILNLRLWNSAKPTQIHFGNIEFPSDPKYALSLFGAIRKLPVSK